MQKTARLWWLILGVLAVISAPAVLLAHTVPVEQVIVVDARLEGASLLVHLHIPIDALSGAGLPRSPDGALSPDVTAAQLDTVASDAIRNLDVRAEQGLRPLRLVSAASADRMALDVDAAFPATTLSGVDVRVNAFQGDTLKPVVTRLQVQRPDGGTSVIRIDGPTTRVVLAPGSADVIPRFAALSAHIVIGWGDQILVTLCLLAAPLTGTTAARRIALLVAAQIAGMALVTVAGSGGGTLALTAAIAASMVVLAGIVAVLPVRSSYVSAGTVAFGLLNGTALASSLGQELPLAGTHRLLAVAVFTLFMVIAEGWIGAMAFAVRRWLADRGTRDVLIRYGVAILVVHTGLHRFADAGAVVASSGSLAATHAVMLITLGWVALVLVIAVAGALRHGASADLQMVNART